MILRDVSFVPRAFSITQINMTHRNWTAVGLPDIDWYPLVDPRGLVTPYFDSWSIDFWIVPDEGEPLYPSRSPAAGQRLLVDNRLAVVTEVAQGGGKLTSLTEVDCRDAVPMCRIQLTATHQQAGWLAVALRPANPEGISFIHDISWAAPDRLIVNDAQTVELARPPDRVCMSQYRQGDVAQDIRFRDAEETCGVEQVHCDVGLATAAALYRLRPGIQLDLEVRLEASDGGHKASSRSTGGKAGGNPWRAWLDDVCRVQTPDERLDELFDISVRGLLLHTAVEAVPGPYTYKRFWFRDAAFLLQSLLVLGYFDRVERILSRFPDEQTRSGYFRSQEGEWDSNGEAIWIIDCFRRMSGRSLSDRLLKSVMKGARWIEKKRTDAATDTPYAGLMPAGFSAEHLGPNDYYYWDDFWSAAGMRCAADIVRDSGRVELAAQLSSQAESLLTCIDRSISRTAAHRDRGGVPASPNRRMDSGAIGSIVAGYPLQLWQAGDARLLGTADFLWCACTVDGGFFQDMIHSGINAYLTLHLAQVFLRRRSPLPRLDAVGGPIGIAHRAVARGNPSTYARRMHGGWSTHLGFGRMGDDDS